MYSLNGTLAYNIALFFTTTKLNNVYIKDMLRPVNIASLHPLAFNHLPPLRLPLSAPTVCLLKL
jgi:hypothetical protein